MNRRFFLKSLLQGAALTAAGLYVPKVIYSFPPPRPQLVAKTLLVYDMISLELVDNTPPSLMEHIVERFAQAAAREEDEMLSHAEPLSAVG
jgi:hypothetical protein